MTRELPDIFDRIAALELGVPAPSGEKDITVATDELVPISTFPAFVNVESGGEVVQSSGAWGYINYRINLYLLFAPASAKYSLRSMRKWVRPVINHFKVNTRLSGDADVAPIESFDFSPVVLDGTTYHACTFTLRARVKEDWA